MSPQKYIIWTVPEIVSPEGGVMLEEKLCFPGGGRLKYIVNFHINQLTFLYFVFSNI